MSYYKYKRIEVGDRYGRWLVTAQGPTKLKTPTSTSNTTWVCLCECGNTKTVAQAHLVKGSSRSCGCLQRLMQQYVNHHPNPTGPSRMALMNEVRNSYIQSARKRQLSWEIRSGDFYTLIQDPCIYCGLVSEDSSQFNGLDRVDNSVGYAMCNVVTCCKTCNYAKHTMQLSDFLAWITKVSNNLRNTGVI